MDVMVVQLGDLVGLQTVEEGAISDSACIWDPFPPTGFLHPALI